MKPAVLITGGAGFIGSHLANELLTKGYRVRALDAMIPQVHGPDAVRPDYLDPEVELIHGDIRNPELVDKALRGMDAVYHLVALVGVGQSMYQIEGYTNVNNLGTAILLERIAKRPIQKLVVASSMSIYGEGHYVDDAGNPKSPAVRSIDQLRRREWEMKTADGAQLRSMPTPEWKSPSLASVYALSKFDQEQLCLITGRTYGIPTVAMRFFNVYGPNQALSNPYTGALAIFASRLLNGQRPVIFEDGKQMRDFVSVYDIATACRLALETDVKDVAINVGSGETFTISETARQVTRVLGRDVEPEITGTFRVGDIRHCIPNLTLARQLLGYQPRVNFETGLQDLASWLERQIAHDRFDEMQGELSARGLVA